MSTASRNQMVRISTFLQQKVFQLVGCLEDCQCVIRNDEHEFSADAVFRLVFVIILEFTQLNLFSERGICELKPRAGLILLPLQSIFVTSTFLITINV